MILSRRTTVATISVAVSIMLLTSLDAVALSNQSTIGQQLLKLTQDDPGNFDEYGYSVAIDGGLAMVGAEDDDDPVAGASVGSAYIFDAATGAQLRKLSADDAAEGSFLGYSSALDASAGAGGLALAGAIGARTAGEITGAAYLFNATSGQQLAKLTASDAAPGDEFGVAVAVDGGIAVVGARRDDSPLRNAGSAYLFSTDTGEQLFKLTAADASAGDQFGTSVDIDGEVVAVGAYLDDGGLGGAYLFDATSGSQLRKLLPADTLGRIQFGISVAIDDGRVLVGARGNRPDGVFTGVAYVFDVSTGQQLFQLIAPDGAAFDNFGASVALDGRLAVIAAHEDDAKGVQSGSAYVFDVTTGELLAKITADDGAAGDLFGWSVAIDSSPASQSRAVVGARYGDPRSIGSGSAYVFNAAVVPEPSGAALVLSLCVLTAFSRVLKKG